MAPCKGKAGVALFFLYADPRASCSVFEPKNQKPKQEDKTVKYTPKKVFILEEGKYIEMSYEEFNRRKQEDESYQMKRFLSLHGMLMEVTEEDYVSYYKDKRRQRYIEERAKKFGTFSYDAFTTDEFNGEDILVDSVTDISKEVEHHLMLEKLLNVFQGLTSDEQALVKAIYFDGLSEREYAAQLGVYPNAVHKRKVRILEKLKKMMEN